MPVRTYNKKDSFDDFNAVYVNNADQYQQKDYDRILETEHNTSVNLWAWKKDKAAAEIAILCADKRLENVAVTVSDLKGEADIIPSSDVKASFIREVRAYTGHAGWYAHNPKNRMPSGERDYFPEVIYSDTPVTIDSGKLQLVWVEVITEKDTQPGNYHSEITISAENSDKTIVLDFSVEVLNLILPDTKNYLFDTEYWSYPYNCAYYYDVEPFSDEHMKILKQHMTLYKNLGGHAVTASIVEEAWGGQTYGGGRKIHYPSMIKWIKKSDGQWYFDYTDFDKWIKLNQSIGIADKIICYSMMPWNGIVRYYDENSKKEKKVRVNPAKKKAYEKVWLPFLKSFVRHLDDMGWFECTYIGFDERNNMKTALDLIDSVKNKDGLILKKSAAFNDFKHNAAIFSRLDSASVGLDQIRANLNDFKNQIKHRREKNQETTMYTATEHIPNSFTKSIPVESYWTILFAASLNTTGFLRWAYDAWVENPLEDATHWSFPAGDCFLVYPSEKKEGRYESKYSLRLAKLDEGVRDANKLYLLREKSPGIAAQIEKLFSEIKGSSENSYEFYSMSKTNIWGRKAKWLTPHGKAEMLKDMQKVKNRIYEISKMYCEEDI